MTHRSRASTNVPWNRQPGFTTTLPGAGESIVVTGTLPMNAILWRFAVPATKPATPLQRVLERLAPRLPGLHRLLRGDPGNTRHLPVLCPGVPPQAGGDPPPG